MGKLYGKLLTAKKQKIDDLHMPGATKFTAVFSLHGVQSRLRREGEAPALRFKASI